MEVINDRGVGGGDKLHSPGGFDVTLWRIHGDFEHPDRLVITDEDYNRYYESHNAIWARMLVLFSGRALLLLGYSARDPDYKHIEKLLRSSISSRVVR